MELNYIGARSYLHAPVTLPVKERTCGLLLGGPQNRNGCDKVKKLYHLRNLFKILHFLDIGSQMAARLSALRAGRSLFPRNIFLLLVLIPVRD
jgi:hypothetical protein